MEHGAAHLRENCKNAEIAFFGGSFTALDKPYMLELLETARKYIPKFKGIRISTRPDCIDDAVLTLLQQYHVTAIELGAQSMDNRVLQANTRGHTADDVVQASKLIKQYGFSLGLQMMTGLYQSNVHTDWETAKALVRLQPETVRIYPTVIMKHTRLETLYHSGEYVPESFDATVDLCAGLLQLFEENQIKVIRLGLHHSESLEQDMVAGNYHPAFRELCESRILYHKIIETINKNGIPKGHINVYINPKSVSKLVGQKKENIHKLHDLGYHAHIIQNTTVTGSHIKVEKG